MNVSNIKPMLAELQLTTHHSRRQLLILSPLQTREDVLQRTRQHIFLDDFRLESKACTVQTNIEITVPVEHVRLTSDLESSSNPRKCAATQQPIFLDDVCLESKACTVQTNIRNNRTVENVRLTSDLKSSSKPAKMCCNSTAHIPRRCLPGIQDMYSTNEDKNNRTRGSRLVGNTDVHELFAD